MFSTDILRVILTRAIIVIACVSIQGTTFAASHSWLGNTSAFWTVASNWTNGTPSGGDDLYFVAGGLNNRSNYNNFTTGFPFGQITISEANNVGYVLAGNPITLNNGIAAFGTTLSIQPQVDFDITCASNQVWSSARSLAFNGHVELNARVVTLNNPGTITFNGLVTGSDVNGVSTMEKTNSGLLYFSANSRLQTLHAAYIPLTVYQGSLRFDGVATNGDSGLARGYYSIDAHSLYGPVTVTGTGSIDAIHVENATLSPGDSAPGILRCDAIDLLGTLSIQINGTNAGTDYSQLVTQLAYLGDEYNCEYGSAAFLNLQFGYTPQIGDSFLIINGPNGYYFNGLPPSCVLQTNGLAFGINYNYRTGVTVTTLWSSNSAYSMWSGSTNLQDRKWSTATNWAGGMVPTNGSRLQFTAFQARNEQLACGTDEVVAPPLTNDLVSGTSMASMLLTASNYVIYGNPLLLTEGVTNRVSFGTNSCFFDVVASSATTFVVDDGSILLMGGHFTGSGTLHKQGGGELRMTGTTQNSFSGSVSVEGGSVRVDGSFLDGSFAVSSGTLTGSGAVSAVTMNGGTLSPGTGPGVLQVQGNLTMNNGSVFQVELNGSTPGSGYDQLQVNGTVNINGAVLDLHPTNGIATGTAFLILINDGTDAIDGTFAGLPEGAMFAAAGQYFSITYAGGSGNDVMITRINPPAVFGYIMQSSSNAVQISGTGGSNLNYTIQATTNLPATNWVNIGTAPVDGTGHFNFTDTNLLLYPRRFFRALAQ